MSDNPERPRVSLSVDPQASAEGPVLSETPPFCVVVLGDFSARAHRAHRAAPPAPPLAERRPVPAPSVEELLDRLRPALDFELEGPGRVRIEVRALEDLHPDRLVVTVPHLRRLSEAIEPAVAGHRDAGAGLRDRAVGGADGTTGGRADAASDAARPTPAGLLDEIVEATPRAPERPTGGSLPELEGWIRSVVAPHLVGRETEGQEALRARLRGEAADQLRRVLDAPPVRAYEGLLRSLLLLLAEADPSAGAHVHVLDVTRAELEADLAGGLERSGVLRALAEPLPGPCGAAVPALVVGAYAFGGAVRDVAFLNRIAMLAHTLGVAWISSAGVDLLGVDRWDDLSGPFPDAADPPELWQALRETEAAGAVGLVAPPFLARMPYGAATDPCEIEGFEEIPPGEPSATGRYVWGDPGFLCAAALVASFVARGWRLDAEGPADFGGRPFHALESGSVGAYPLAAPWTADAAERVRGRGVMPLVTYRGEARVRLSWIGPIAAPRGPFTAWWSSRGSGSRGGA